MAKVEIFHTQEVGARTTLMAEDLSSTNLAIKFTSTGSMESMKESWNKNKRWVDDNSMGMQLLA